MPFQFTGSNYYPPQFTNPTVNAPTQNNWGNLQYQQPSNSGPTTIALVKGQEGAMSYPVAAGVTVLLIDFEAGQFWLKSTAQNGAVQPLRSFSFIENTPKVDSQSEFVTKKELDDLKSYLDNQFQNVRSQIHKIKKGKEE